MDDRKQQTLRVFVNNVDAYSSRHIAEVLGRSEAGEESDDDGEAEETPSPRDEPAFQVVGTVSSASSSKEKNLKFLQQQYVSPAREELFQLLLDCDVVVYNVTESSTQQQVEEATWAVTVLRDEMQNFKSRKYFILISSVMTWAMTKPSDDDPEAPFLEEEFIRRRPHTSFRNHNNLEKLVLKLPRGKASMLKGYVVAAGLQYGMGENIFHYFFKVSWLMQDPQIPIFGDGTNHIPMIHVCDLGGVIQNIIKLKPRSKYILAIDDSKNTLEDIVKTVSDVLGPEKVYKLPLEDAITMKAFKPEELDCLSINLRLEASIVSDMFSFEWICRDGMLEKMRSIVNEYKHTRQLLAIKICLVGPPAVGKTTVAKKLCQHYKIHHININSMIEEKIAQLKEIINGSDLDDISEEDAAVANQQLEMINQSMEKNQGQLAEHQVFDILREILYSTPCRNQGFVLDGFPETSEQAKMIFSDEEPENQDSDAISKIPWYNNIITPEHVFALDASDDFLTKRVQGLPESIAEKMCYTQEEFLARLARYRQLFSMEENLLDFFDHREIHPQCIEISSDDLEYTGIMKKITEIVGVPKNYGRSPEEQEEENQRREDERKQKLAAEATERKKRNKAALAKMTDHYEEWKKNLLMVKQQESEMLEAKALPLRNYLMKYVMPSLTEAMLECSKIKPEDPVDFLAEHLLQNNKED